ncbi:MAG: hypothetical protein IT303_10845 [Dehalococcoidia bacterium]|nr:hypothetical protein [Dehalococcoidia bacterium]
METLELDRDIVEIVRLAREIEVRAHRCARKDVARAALEKVVLGRCALEAEAEARTVGGIARARRILGEALDLLGAD